MRVGNKVAVGGDGRRIQRTGIVASRDIETRTIGRRHQFPIADHRVAVVSVAVVSVAVRQQDSIDIPTLAEVVVAEEIERQLGDDGDSASIAADDRPHRSTSPNVVASGSEIDDGVVGEILQPDRVLFQDRARGFVCTRLGI